MRATIICIGNTLVAEDAAGMQVYKRLEEMAPLPDGVALVEGGLAGLNLLPFFEQGGRVILVDAVQGFADSGNIVILDWRDVVSINSANHYDHEAGLPYLLSVLPHVCEGILPEEIALVGIEGTPKPSVIENAARLSIELAVHGLAVRE